jgi:hypothetical protein
VEGVACADRGARTPIGVSGIKFNNFSEWGVEVGGVKLKLKLSPSIAEARAELGNKLIHA